MISFDVFLIVMLPSLIGAAISAVRTVLVVPVLVVPVHGSSAQGRGGRVLPRRRPCGRHWTVTAGVA